MDNSYSIFISTDFFIKKKKLGLWSLHHKDCIISSITDSRSQMLCAWKCTNLIKKPLKICEFQLILLLKICHLIKHLKSNSTYIEKKKFIDLNSIVKRNHYGSKIINLNQIISILKKKTLIFFLYLNKILSNESNLVVRISSFHLLSLWHSWMVC